MAKKTIVKKKSYDLLDSIEHTVALSKNSKMCDELLQNKYVVNLAQRMDVTPVQAVIFSLCMHYGPANTLMSELAEHLDVSKISVLHFGDDIDSLVSHKLLRYRDSDQMSFDVPIPVINELKHNRVYTPPSLSGLDANELFSRLNIIFTDVYLLTLECRDGIYVCAEWIAHVDLLRFQSNNIIVHPRLTRHLIDERNAL